MFRFKKMKKSNIFIIILIASFIILAFIYERNKRDLLIKEAQKFYNHEVIGVVFLSDYKYKFDHIILNDSSEYFFSRFIGIDTNEMPFAVIEKGDSIYKKALSDTLYIIKKNDVIFRYYYRNESIY